MKKTYLFLLAAAAVLMSSCSPFTLVNSEVYNDARLSDYHTFRIVTPGTEGKLPPGMQMVTYYNIAAAIREQMVERGFTEDPNSPMLINIGLTVHKEIETAPAMPPAAPLPQAAPLPPPLGAGPIYGGPYYNGYYPYFIYPRSYYWPAYQNAQVITGIYKEGVLTMDIVNMEKKLPLYSASVATILENGQSQFRDLQGVAEAVQTLFSKFPVAKLPQYTKQQ